MTNTKCFGGIVKMRTLMLLFLTLVAVAAVPRNTQRIVGGSVTTISQYPSTAALLYSATGTGIFTQACGGAIISNRAVLTAAHCTSGDLPSRWQFRVGSTTANSGGLLRSASTIITHPQYDEVTYNNDLAIIRTNTNMTYNSNVQVAPIAGSNYNLADNQVVWAAGWGASWYDGAHSNTLNHVQLITVNHNVCTQRYDTTGNTITENMLCAGWLDVGGRAQCQGDSGSPLYHHGILVGVYSWSHGCGLPFFPGVNVRVSLYSTWIGSNL